MNYLLQLIFAILTISQAITVYPNLGSSKVQWEEQIWMDCKSEQLIVPTNCKNNDQNWIECYEIPESGLCLKDKLKISKQSTYNLIFTFQNLSTQTPQILINDSKQEQKSYPNNQIIIKTVLDQQKINIKILGTNSKLQKFALTTDCHLNCKECDANFECTNCIDHFSMINYQCIPDSCFDTLSGLTTQSAYKANSLIDKQGMYQVTVDFDVNLGQCLIPKVYIIQEIKSNKIEYVLASNQISLNSEKQLSFHLTQDQVTQYCKIMVQDKTKIIRQCSLSIALTTAQIAQYNLLLLGDITTNLETSASISTTQIITIPEDGNIQLEVTNEITKGQVNNDLLTITQAIYNEDLKIENVMLKEAYLEQNGQAYDSLDFMLSFVRDQKITYKFKIKKSDIKFDQQIDLVLSSDLLASRRVLTQDRSQLKIQYKATNSIKFLPNELSQMNSNTDSKANYLIYGITIFLVLSLLITIVWHNKSKKNHYVIGEEVNQKNI
ncbi:unnamed protein product (macronuclear) [Paramecium tetraurelia]|uniref:Transmembrane protein n=1 Tax=Paramecium tetraurelia TaxID=5888 RepID=A0BDL4_PARTE|nr:uncharacterized protein GSPATT00027660001 [Paramecium tetraurelia]CAK56631.1 unnamed protein product [Paramecium tetraurelia]|eukprot:XP_001424029.1 hypothetical protein (macronuclear) [Paramecium tetraurelia strain d4-2]